MSDAVTSAAEFRTAALRMVAATEYFKVAGELPSWARAELDAWSDRDGDPVDEQRRPPVPAASA